MVSYIFYFATEPKETYSSCLLSRRFNHTTGVFLCQKFLSTIKIAIIPYIPRITAIILKSSYFYIVSRQEETRFTRFKKRFLFLNKKESKKRNYSISSKGKLIPFQPSKAPANSYASNPFL